MPMIELTIGEALAFTGAGLLALGFSMLTIWVGQRVKLGDDRKEVE